MTAPSREVREAAERAARELHAEVNARADAGSPVAINYLHGAVAGYLRGHADATAAHAARVAELVELIVRIDDCEACCGPDGGLPLCDACQDAFYEAIDAARALNDTTRPLAGSEE